MADSATLARSSAALFAARMGVVAGEGEGGIISTPNPLITLGELIGAVAALPRFGNHSAVQITLKAVPLPSQSSNIERLKVPAPVRGGRIGKPVNSGAAPATVVEC